MTQTEREYEQILSLRQSAGEIALYWFECWKVRIGYHCWYTPDFAVILADGSFEFHEVKGGYIEEDSHVKLKAAADKYFPVTWRLMQKKKGQWSESVL